MADDEDDLFRLTLAAEVPKDAWRNRLEWTSGFKGTTGLDDRFIHLLSAEQVAGAVAAFDGKADVMLLRFSVDIMREADLDLRWEADEPHIYGGLIPYACLAAPPALLALGNDGKHVLPPLGRPAAAAAAGREEVADDNSDDFSDGMDGYTYLTK